MAEIRYRYSVRFINKNGEWQEEDAFETKTKAEEIKEKVLARENRETKIVDLANEQGDVYY